MSNTLYNLRGIVTLVFILANTIIQSAILLPFAILKFLIPISSVEAILTRVLDGIGESWISVNKWFFENTRNLNLSVTGADNLERKEWYLCIANHQTWADILVIQFALNKKIPFLKFFIKKQLLWLPIFGAVWYAMDYPFMSRYSKETL